MLQRQVHGEKSLDHLGSDALKINIGGLTANTAVRAALYDVLFGSYMSQALARPEDRAGYEFVQLFESGVSGGLRWVWSDPERFNDDEKYKVKGNLSTALSEIVTAESIGTDHWQSAERWSLQAGSQALRSAAPDNDRKSDFMLGGTRGDVLYGGGGDDILLGGAGDDYLYGGAHDDRLHGGAGNDLLYGGTGVDLLAGGEGDDLYVVRANEGTKRIVDTGTNDTLRYIDANGNAYTFSTHAFALDQPDTWRSILPNGTTVTWTVDSGLVGSLSDGTRIALDGYSNGDYGLRLKGARPVDKTPQRTINGDYQPLDINLEAPGLQHTTDDLGNLVTSTQIGTVNDVLRGSSGVDRIRSGFGKDVVAGLAGDDQLELGGDSDLGDGGEGDDRIEGGAGSDVLMGGKGRDRLYAEYFEDEADVYRQTQGSGRRGDWLVGGLDEDLLFGFNGNDVLFGGGGEDFIVAGAGDDIISDDDEYVAALNGRYRTDDPVTQSIATYTPNFEWSVRDRSNPFDKLFETVINAEHAREVGAGDIIYAGAGNDFIIATFGEDTVYGESGNDIISGGEQADTLIGGDGDDRITGEFNGGIYDDEQGVVTAGGDYIDGGAGNDTLQGEDGGDQIYGGTGNDTLLGDRQNLAGSAHGRDYMDGEEGNDQLVGDGGADHLLGGEGDDVLLGDSDWVATDYHGADHLDGEAGNDTLYGHGGNDQLYGDSGNDVLDGGKGDDTLDGDTGNDLLTGADGVDRLFGGEGSDSLVGGEGNDLLYGDAGNDVLDGGAGNDTLTGGDGIDLLQGGDGDDTYYLDEYDRIVDTAGNNRVVFSGGTAPENITLFATSTEGRYQAAVGNAPFATFSLAQGSSSLAFEFAGGRRMSGEQLVAERYEGSTNLSGDDENNTLQGYAGSDLISGEGGDDTLRGLGGDDALHGGADDDLLEGGAGKDSLHGDEGDDTLEGGTGDDLLEGGSGADTYRFTLGAGRDTLNEHSEAGSTDTVVFGQGIEADAVTLTRFANGDLHLSLKDASTLLIKGQYKGAGSGIEALRFADGTVLDGDDLAAVALAPISGTAGDDSLTGSLHAETLQGKGGNDVLDGQGGDDLLQGGDGVDSYRIMLGMGRDVIDDASRDGNVLRLDAGIGFDNLVTARRGDDLQVSLRGLDEGVILRDYHAVSQSWTLRNAAGSTLAMTDLIERAGQAPQDRLARERADFIQSVKHEVSQRYLTLLDDHGNQKFFAIGDGVWRSDGRASSIEATITKGYSNTTTVIQDGSSAPPTYSTSHRAEAWVLGPYPGPFLADETVSFTVQTSTDPDAAYGSYLTQIQGETRVETVTGRVSWGPVRGTGTFGSSTQRQSLNGKVVETTINRYDFSGSARGTWTSFSSWDGRNNTTAPRPDSVKASFYHDSITHRLYDLRGTDGDDVFTQGDMLDTGAGNDTVSDAGFVHGGEGDDHITRARVALGGAGDDAIFASARVVGGRGNDYLDGTTVIIDTATDGRDVIWSSTPDTQIKAWYYGGQLQIANWQFRESYAGRRYLPAQTWNLAIDNGEYEETVTITLGDIALNADGTFADGFALDRTTVQEALEAYAARNRAKLPIVEALPDADYSANDVADLSALLDAGALRRDRIELPRDIALKDISVSWGEVLNPSPRTGALEAYRTLDLSWGSQQGVRIVVPHADDPLGSGIEEVLLGNGETMSLAQLMARAPENLNLDPQAQGADIELDALSAKWFGDSAQNYTGGRGNDRIRGNAQSNALHGQDGDDRLYGLGGDDILSGGSGADRLDGGEGNDTLRGGLGDDVYVVDSDGDVAIEAKAQGIDTVEAAVSWQLGGNFENLILTGTQDLNGTGNAFDNTLIGNAGANILRGGSGADRLRGGLGDDTYYLDDAGDRVEESAEGGMDTVRASVDVTLSDHIEVGALLGSQNLSLTGNALDNRLFGNAGDNHLIGGAGNDTLTAYAGSNTLEGGRGDDVYVVASIQDHIVELSGEGHDTVRASVGHALADHVENLTLTGSGDIDATGNALDNLLVGNSGDNTLSGGAGNDTLDAIGGGVDQLMGGQGDDRYLIYSSADRVVEQAGEGSDTVVSKTHYQLGDHVEHLIFSGLANVHGTGNAQDNLLRGNGAINRLNGGQGIDLLEGLGGNDILTDSTGRNYLAGGDGNDILASGSDGDLLVGGSGNDLIKSGSGPDVVLFNRGDGLDTFTPSQGRDNTLSLGGGIRYDDLRLSRQNNDLLLDTGADERVTLKDWYLNRNAGSLLNLQMVVEASADFDATSSDALRSRKLSTFDFNALVGEFDRAGALTGWALRDALTQFHLGGSDNAALGGDLAYLYGRDGTLAGISAASAQDILRDERFGRGAQALRPLNELSSGGMALS